MPLQLPSDEVPPESDHMWPLDLALVALGGSLMYMAASRLGWDDPRWLFNAKTYAVAIPAGMVGLDLLLRNVATRFMQRSLQFGFLVSMFVHLMLLILAINVVILRYWPEQVAEVQSMREPKRKTLPDNLFQVNRKSEKEKPDWSKPVDATSEARVTPIETKRVQRIEEVANRLEMPTPPKPEHQSKPYLIERQQSTQAQPTPADAPSRLSKQVAPIMPQKQSSAEAIQAPDVPIQSTSAPALTASGADIARSQAMGASASMPRSATGAMASLVHSPEIARRTQQQQTPQIQASPNAAAIARQRRQMRSMPSMSGPAVPSVKIAQSTRNSTRQLSDRSVHVVDRSVSSKGASLSNSPNASQFPNTIASQGQGAAHTLQRADTGSAAMPSLSNHVASSASPLTGRSVSNSPLTTPALGNGQIEVPTPQGNGGDAAAGDSGKAMQMAARGVEAERRSSALQQSASLGSPSPLMIEAATGPAGLGAELAPHMGFPSNTQSEQPIVAIAPIESRLQRRQLGGLAPPPAAKVASVEPFRRRLMRTEGGAAPAPAGLVGPETEEAIERGLLYLAQRQNEDGSWSLQGHGENVLLQSDTAATALCILAFQGAGYTHLKHQHANTVAKAINFLRTHQKSNGDLFVSEDPVSNRNVWLYSHGIAALAICESFGMTQDPELAGPAQKAIDFIVASQHKQRGGWRYQPQISSDTSVTGWMMMALKSGELAGLKVPETTYDLIDQWLSISQDTDGKPYLFRYNPYALDTPAQRHGRDVTPTMTAVGMLIRTYRGWRRDNNNMEAGADYLLQHLPDIGTPRQPKRDTYYWYYATQVMFHMGGDYWQQWNDKLHPLLIGSQLREGADGGSWDPRSPIADRWSQHGGRLYLTTMNLLSLEIYYRHLPIYEDTAR